ncbi:MAG TPA: methyltransferase domain-containing protein [Candidatus Saccharimonadales bacterium]|nr:methyltransferase domain-containing protein [Candidatus Saccharimonadales bacterium]
MNSPELSRRFYNEYGAKALEKRVDPAWTEAAVNELSGLIPPGSAVLDAGCGYGRIAIPLSRKGYDVTGIDVSEVLIRAAKEKSSRASFRVASMTDIPFPDNSFQAVIVMWSAFNELLHSREQKTAILELYRVLSPQGLLFIDSFTYSPASKEQIEAKERFGPENRISSGIAGAHYANPDFSHDRESYGRLLESAGIGIWEFSEGDFGGRSRQLVKIVKK